MKVEKEVNFQGVVNIFLLGEVPSSPLPPPTKILEGIGELMSEAGTWALPSVGWLQDESDVALVEMLERNHVPTSLNSAEWVRGNPCKKVRPTCAVIGRAP